LYYDIGKLLVMTAVYIHDILGFVAG
jgi:hypothetical protein